MTREEWAAEMLRRQVAKIASGTGERSRHDAIRAAAACLGHYVAAGAISESVVAQEIEQVASTILEAGRMGEVRRLVRSGIAKGDASKASFGSAGAFLGSDRTITIPWRGQTIRVSRDHGTSVVSSLPAGTIPAVHAVATETVRITTFPDSFNPRGTADVITWTELAEELTSPAPWPESGKKTSIQMWTAAEIEGDDRSKRPDGIDALGRERYRSPECSVVHALVLDYDDDPDWSIEQVARWWAPIQYVAHTTSSHMVEKATQGGRVHPAGPRGRVVVALSRPVTPEEYATLAQWVLGAGKGTPGTAELSSALRGFYVPTLPPHGAYEQGANLTGIGLDVDAILEAAREIGAAAEAAAQDTLYTTTPDGRPYLVKITGASAWFVATADSYAIVDEPLLRAELGRHWPELPTSAPSADPEAPPKPMGPSALFSAYGVRAEEVVYSYTGATRFVARPGHTGDLRIRCLSEPSVEPKRHADVLEWLHVLAGDRIDTLLDWLATAPLLERPTAALLLLGPDSLGKSMIAYGLARYFGASVADYDDVFKGRFNDALLRSPIVFLDEGTQVDGRSAGFRKLIANASHSVEAKGRPSATLEGCPRLVVAANNPDPLKLSREDLSRHDEDAIGERILMVECRGEAKGYLASRGGPAHTHDWVRRGDGPGKIPEMIEWLRTTRTVETSARFLVRGDAAAWAATVGTRTGLPATILDAIAAWLSDHAVRELVRHAEPFVVHEDDVLVSNIRLRSVWPELMRDRPPSHIQVAKALERLSGGRSSQVTLPNGKRVRLTAVARSLLGDRVDS